MNAIADKDIKILKEQKSDYKVSIYIPVLPGSRNIKENISRLHSTVKTLKEKLNQGEISQKEATRLIDFVRSMTNKVSHPARSGALLIFATTKKQRAYFSPNVSDWLLYINNNYLLNPIEEALRKKGKAAARMTTQLA